MVYMKNTDLIRWIGFLGVIVLMFSCQKTSTDNEEDKMSAPVITGIILPSGYGGDVVRIQGKYFGDKRDLVKVFFGGQPAELTELSDTELQVIIPHLSGKVVIQVEVATRKSNVQYFQYLQTVDDQDFAREDRNTVTALMTKGDPMIWVFTGNSITQGAKHTHGSRPYAEIFSERVRYEMDRSRDYVINMGISGHTLRQILADFDHRVTQFNPSVVFCMVGTNDAAANSGSTVAQYGEQLETFISRVRTMGAVPILLTPSPIITNLAPERATLWNYVNKMREVAIEQHVILVDNWSHWQNELNQKYRSGIFRELLNDPLHPNGQGHKEIARALFKELGIFDANQPTGGAPYYEGEH